MKITKKKIKQILFEDSINISNSIIMVASIILILVSYWLRITTDRLFLIPMFLGIMICTATLNIRKHLKNNKKD